jgi:hypothetical protein
VAPLLKINLIGELGNADLKVGFDATTTGHAAYDLD